MMDMNAMLNAVTRMFPNANLSSTVQKAQEMMQGTPDTLDGVSAVAKRIGIDQNMINNIFDKYGNTMQAKALCSMLGTTPEALKKDADVILNGANKPESKVSTRFPRLK